MPVARTAPSGWRKHVPDYWLVAGVIVAVVTSAALLLGFVPLP